MILTEEEAKTKWCPEARAMREDGAVPVGGVNRFNHQPDVDCFCIGSACMAWRWFEGGFHRGRLYNASDEIGYCGKAGRP